MKRIFSVFSVALVLSACTCNVSSGNVKVGNGKRVFCKGPVVEKSFELSGFDAITINGAADIEIAQGTDWSVRVVANEEVFDYLNYRIVDDTVLLLETVDHVNIAAKEYDIFVTVPELTSICVNGAADMDFKLGYRSDKDLRVVVNGAGDLNLYTIEVPSLQVELNGAADVNLKSVKVQKIDVQLSGAGDVDVSGTADEARLSVSGAGVIDARGLDCPNVKKSRAGVAVIRTR